jgi:dTDP-4-amino-4,6-dideoxygalactose transaminase
MPRIHLSPPDVGPLEREYLLGALDTGWVAPAGPELDRFEDDVAELTGWRGAVA